MKKPLIAIEHLEGHFSRWIRAEYEHTKELIGDRLVVTNAASFCREISAIVGRDSCFKESILNLRGVLYSDPTAVIVLDPRAEERLKPGEAAAAEVIVVGGILGDHPPRGRTWELLTEKALSLGMRARNIGTLQLSIDGAAYVAYRVAEGASLESIKLIANPVVEIELGDGLIREVELPFAYPLVDGRPLLYRKVIELLRRGLGYEEYRLVHGS